MKDKLLSRIISIGLTACLVSGYALAQDFAFYALLVMNILAWVGLVCLEKLGEEVWRKVTDTPVISWALTIASIAALVYSGHPGLAASSLICSVMIWSSAKSRLEKLA